MPANLAMPSQSMYHLVLHTQNQQAMFLSDRDRCYFLEIIEGLTHSLGFKVHAYCLMSDYSHLLLEVASLRLNLCIEQICRCYHSYTKKRFYCSFPLQTRHFSLKSDYHFFAVLRYIESCSFQQGVVSHPLAYPWSSYQTYVDHTLNPWVTTSLVLAKFHHCKTRAMQAYCDFIMGETLVKHSQAWVVFFMRYGFKLFSCLLNLVEKGKFHKKSMLDFLLNWWEKQFFASCEDFTAYKKSKRWLFFSSVLSLILHEANIAKFKQLALYFSISADRLAFGVYLLKQRIVYYPELEQLLSCLSTLLQA